MTESLKVPYTGPHVAASRATADFHAHGPHHGP